MRNKTSGTERELMEKAEHLLIRTAYTTLQKDRGFNPILTAVIIG